MQQQQSGLGKHVLVWGATGSGKSTVARTISAALAVPVVELDALYWLPDWASPTEESFLAAVLSALHDCGNGWVVDGNYSRLWPNYLAEADAVVWLDLPFRVTFPRMLLRTARGLVQRDVLWEKCPQTWRQAWWLVRWAISSQRRRDERAGRILTALAGHPHVQLLRLRTGREVSAFLAALASEPDRPSQDALGR